MPFQAPRGTEDVLPSQSHRWQFLEKRFAEAASHYGYLEIRTPTFEETDVFLRTAGDTSDIVTKEMYTFKDKGDRSMTLKPEGTAPVMRAVVEHGLVPPGTVSRMWYIIPFFRYGRPQKGRLREAHQFGLELVGSGSILADAEVIELTSWFFRDIGINDAVVHINSLGHEECRSRYREEILRHMAGYLESCEPEVRERAQKNPLGLLDSKDPEARAALQGLAPITDYLEPKCRERFEDLQDLLSDAHVPYVVDPQVVRGLDYYTETVFEVLSDRLGAQSSLCGGGRYDHLVQQMGGSATPCVGVGIGVERTLLVLESMGVEIPAPRLEAFVVSASPAAVDQALATARTLRQLLFKTIVDLDAKSLKSQLRQADKSGARYAVIIGDAELQRGTVQLKDLLEGGQQELTIPELLPLMMKAKYSDAPDDGFDE